jgi:hypothetical protein
MHTKEERFYKTSGAIKNNSREFDDLKRVSQMYIFSISSILFARGE